MGDRLARLVITLAAACGLAACGSNVTAVERGSSGGRLAVTVDARGGQGTEAMDIARRYAPNGAFSLEYSSTTEMSTDGDSAAESSTVVVFDVAGGVEQVMERLRREPHVLVVTRR